MLIFNISDYTVSSHGNVYTPEREFGTLFEQLFPPILYGEKFAEHQLEGFNFQYKTPEEKALQEQKSGRKSSFPPQGPPSAGKGSGI